MQKGLVLAILCLSLSPFALHAQERKVSVGTVTAVTHFHDVVHHRITYLHPLTLEDERNGWYPDYLRAGFGMLRRNDETAGLYSVGPVWRWNDLLPKCRCFIEAGISAAYLSSPLFHRPVDGVAEDFGTRLQFVSQLSIGWNPGGDSRWAMLLGIQHISNGGISSINPGADFVGVDLQRSF